MNETKRKAVKTLSGTAVAAIAAGLFMGGMVAPAAAADEAKVHCMGVNACKGKSDCKTAASDCKGHNACKGQGFVAMTEKQCTAKGGKVEKM
ncbi:MAG: hypothetical protein KIT73_16575 [Burkholderiales bacterium]|nr:hypothetical protein [Burkholderiales bacterium]